MTNPEIGVAGIKERDIDLLLLEEFVASNDFLRWFFGQVGIALTGPVRLLSSARGVTQSQGESDLEILVANGERQTDLLLIENKIAAAFQPDQLERYRQRGENYVTQGKCSRFRVILCAPRVYLERGAEEFDAAVAYEDLLGWFEGRETDEPRCQFKRKMLASSIEKATHGYQQVEDAPVTSFWDQYWRLVKEIAPELNMNRPGGRPSTSRFFYFLPRVLPRGAKIVHKALQGRVDLQFRGMSDRLDELERMFADCLEPGMSIHNAKKAGVIRILADGIDVGRSFDEQYDAIRDAILSAKQLLVWYQEHQGRWKS